MKRIFGAALPGRQGHGHDMMIQVDPNGYGTGQIDKKLNKKAKLWILKGSQIFDYGKKASNEYFGFGFLTQIGFESLHV